MNHYMLLTGGIVLEIAALVCLRESNGFTRPLAVVGFVVLLAASFYLEALAVRGLPIAFVYAVWAAVGVALMAVVGALVYDEALTPRGLAGLALIMVGVALLTSATTAPASATAATSVGSPDVSPVA